MKQQNGFASLVSILLIALGISFAGGGYLIYKEKKQYNSEVIVQEQKDDQPDISPAPEIKITPSVTPETVVPVVQKEVVPKSEVAVQEQKDDQPDSNPAPESNITSPVALVPVVQKNESVKVVASSTPANTNKTAKTDCNNDWACLIEAADRCQSIIAVINLESVSYPLIAGLQYSTTMKYEIKKSANSCEVISYVESAHMTISPKGRAEALASGSTEIEIDEQLKIMNDNFKNNPVVPTACVGDGGAVADFLVDQKSGLTGKMEFKSSTGQTTLTTSSGQKLVCTNL